MALQKYFFLTMIGAFMVFGAWGIAPLSASAQQSDFPSSATPNPTATAQTSTNCAGAANTGSTIANPLKACSIEALLDIILKAVVKIGAVFLTLALVWTGFKFVWAQGNPEAIKSARNALMWTLIGGLILLGAQAIELVIQATVKTL